MPTLTRGQIEMRTRTCTKASPVLASRAIGMTPSDAVCTATCAKLKARLRGREIKRQYDELKRASDRQQAMEDAYGS